MSIRRTAIRHDAVSALLDLIERRFDVRLAPADAEHLQQVHEHYRQKRNFILRESGPAASLADENYAKAVLISEAARMMILREVMPRPKKKKKQRTPR